MHQIGDQLVFKASEGAGSGGFLIGDAAAFNLGVQEPADHTHRVALNYDEYAFRVVPMLRYGSRSVSALYFRLKPFLLSYRNQAQH
jgi:hypothetical protein